MSQNPPTRIRLGAIAKNEGPHLLDWIFHHLHFGFDEITIWLNGTTDVSGEILEAVTAVEPRIRFKTADRLLAESLAAGKNFQQRAYRRMAKRSADSGFTHLACLDLDEYWTPRNLTSSVHDFVTSEAAVTSFPWCVDVPDPTRTPFVSLFEAPPQLQLDRHVKSIVTLDDRVVQWRTHTARTSSGPRLWVDEPFPLVDEEAQQWGSFVPREWLAARSHAVPSAFVVHAMHRSPVEYVSSLARGRRQTGRQMPVKNNRHGFAASDAPRLAFSGEPAAVEDYLARRRAFLDRVGADALVDRARAQARERADDLIARAATDPVLLQQLRKPLRHVELPVLEAAHPGWDTPLHWRLDRTEGVVAVAEPRGLGRLVRRAVDQQPRPTQVIGWAFDETGAQVEFAIRDGAGRVWEDVEVERVERPDVVAVLPGAPERAGFVLHLPERARKLEDAGVLARSSGSRVWEEWPLQAVL